MAMVLNNIYYRSPDLTFLANEKPVKWLWTNKITIYSDSCVWLSENNTDTDTDNHLLLLSEQLWLWLWLSENSTDNRY